MTQINLKETSYNVSDTQWRVLSLPEKGLKCTLLNTARTHNVTLHATVTTLQLVS